MLLAKKVDLFKETSAGRTAYEIAAQANRQGSHCEERVEEDPKAKMTR